jgi:hypothetical protein
VAEISRRSGIKIEYVETNGFWAGDGAAQKLRALKAAGADTLCISSDAFHAAFVPEALPRRLAEICRQEGFGYFIWETHSIRTGGRAVLLEEKRLPKQPVEKINSRPCRNLLESGHFHADLYEKYVVPGCTGISFPLSEAVRGVPAGKYPAFEALLSGGTEKLLSMAKAQGFHAAEGYTSRCALCFYIRRWLSQNGACPELDPEHYEAI